MADGSGRSWAVWIVGWALLPVFLYMASMTIYSYSRRIDLSYWTPAYSDASTFATSCTKHGPITWQGLGWRYSCRLVVVPDSGGPESYGRSGMGLVYTPDNDAGNARSTVPPHTTPVDTVPSWLVAGWLINVNVLAIMAWIRYRKPSP